ncbi:MAG TPA: LytR family transcriptional regulator [Peptococcaceae bacterium]|nr:LytR family transcriptional regulator [Peptococcaceae bacterium]
MKKKIKNKRKILIIIAVLFAGVLLGTAAFGYVFFTQDIGVSPGDSENLSGGEFPDSSAKLDNRVSVLLIGADKRPGETTYNTDTLIVASVDPETKIISLLSIPRDTRITIGSDQFLKINSAVLHRGIPELLKQVTDLTGIPLDGYIVTNFQGFKGIIDTLGGIDIYVEKRMGPFHTGDIEDGLIDLQQGQQRLNGSLALQYARWRNDDLADIGRTARQQKVLKAIAKEALQPSTITKLPKLIPQVMEMVETNLKLSDLLTLAKVAASFDSSNIVSMTLPGVGVYLDNISFWEVNREQAKEVVQNLLLGITSDRVFDNKVIDLLDPDIKAHITVPGSPKDPNGTDSPGHSVPVKGDGDETTGTQRDPSPGTDEPNQTEPNDGPEVGTEPGKDSGKDPGEETDPGDEPGEGANQGGGPGEGTNPGEVPGEGKEFGNNPPGIQPPGGTGAGNSSFSGLKRVEVS